MVYVVGYQALTEKESSHDVQCVSHIKRIKNASVLDFMEKYIFSAIRLNF